MAALQRLHKAGYRLVMLTGDNPTTANAIAKEAGIDEVIAGVLPDGKAEAIKRLQSEGRQVAMVGDGINDAPALAQADVGIAMGGGSDVAIETAAITLMRHSLMGVADALAISRNAAQHEAEPARCLYLQQHRYSGRRRYFVAVYWNTA